MTDRTTTAGRSGAPRRLRSLLDLRTTAMGCDRRPAAPSGYDVHRMAGRGGPRTLLLHMLQRTLQQAAQRRSRALDRARAGGAGGAGTAGSAGAGRWPGDAQVGDQLIERTLQVGEVGAAGAARSTGRL